jgi:hypothetical protein
MAERNAETPSPPTTDEEFDTIRTAFKANQSDVGCLIVLWACVLGVLVTVLPWSISATKLPTLLRPLWNPYPLILIIGGVLWALLALTPMARQSRRYKGIGRAINSFDRAEGYFSKWQQTRKRRCLQECKEHVKMAQPWLKDVPRFAQFAEQLERVLKEFEIV